MVDDDPFAEPDDTERTVIVPNPGGRRPAAPPLPDPGAPGPAPAPQASAPQAPMPAASATSATLEAGMTGMNPLNAAASTLFALIGRVRNRAQHPDPDALRQSVIAEVRAFESRALKAGVDARQVKVARYAICATLDDVVLNTPWGSASSWAQQSMVATFHRETVGGDRFYDLLARLEADPSNNLDLLEFLYVCLTLGFEGRLRVERGGPERHREVREGLARLIRQQRGMAPEVLSPHWQGVEKAFRPRSRWKPFAIAAALCLGLLGLTFGGLAWALSGTTERVIGQLSVLEPGGAPELARRAPPVPVAETPPDTQLVRLRGFLAPEIEEGIVDVFQDANTITVRINGEGMFGSASDQLTDRFAAPLGRVAEALNDTEGPVIVAGHSDNVPIRSSRFASNMALSLARAAAVMQRIGGTLDDPARLKAEGRSDKEPIADNATAEGRARNRRIEILLVRKDAA